MNSDLKKEYTQKYKLESYSRAIPTKALVEKSVSLGEYCEPVDSRCIKNILSGEGYNSDPDYRYAQPQDAVIKKVKESKQEEVGSIYNLAKVPDEDQGVQSSGKKPSPKPRLAKNRFLDQDDIQQTSKEDRDTHLSGMLKKDHKVKLATSRDPLKRPGKKVVEIEYEVARSASAISSDLGEFKNPGDNHSSIAPGSVKLQAPGMSPARNVSVSSETSHVAPPSGIEVTYEEPWDLKMKRLKQEQERKSKGQSKQAEKISNIKRGNSLFEDAVECMPQRLQEGKTNYLRSVSQTSEVDVFHDALDTVQSQKLLTESENSIKLKPLPTNTYEDAWDLKNSLLEQKIRQMQLQASVTYEEPWEVSKQQQLLQARFQEEKKMEQRSPRHKSVSDTCDTSIDAENDSKTNVVRGKYNSVDESKMKSRNRSCIVGQQINPMIPLANQNWYHGNISREDAEKMLRVCKEGSYIVRVSSDRKSYSLSIKSPKQYIHVQIEQLTTEDGSVCYILGKNSKSFRSIPEMIDYYTNHRVPLKGTEHITLLHPVECKWS